MSELANKKCVPCKSGTPALKGPALADWQNKLGGGWNVVNDHHLEKQYKFEDFRQALAFTNQIGEVAEANNHHPDLFLAWGKVKVTLCTHSIDGLSEGDFILAAKIDQLQQS